MRRMKRTNKETLKKRVSCSIRSISNRSIAISRKDRSSSIKDSLSGIIQFISFSMSDSEISEPPSTSVLYSETDEGRVSSETGSLIVVEFTDLDFSISIIKRTIKGCRVVTDRSTVNALKQLCGRFDGGRLCAIMGPSGSGKVIHDHFPFLLYIDNLAQCYLR